MFNEEKFVTPEITVNTAYLDEMKVYKHRESGREDRQYEIKAYFEAESDAHKNFLDAVAGLEKSHGSLNHTNLQSRVVKKYVPDGDDVFEDHPTDKAIKFANKKERPMVFEKKVVTVDGKEMETFLEAEDLRIPSGSKITVEGTVTTWPKVGDFNGKRGVKLTPTRINIISRPEPKNKEG